MVEAEILSIQVGMPKTYESPMTAQDGEGRTWDSGIFKHGIEGPVFLGETNLGGDGQSDLVHRGGPDRALLIYSARHYPEWESHANRSLEFGSFGENLTVSDVTELDVCLGDIWATKDIEIEVSQPRLPCFKLARRLNWPGLNVEVIKNRKGGWYTRVLKQGMVERDQTLRLVDRSHPTWTIDRAIRLYMSEKKTRTPSKNYMICPS